MKAAGAERWPRHTYTDAGFGVKTVKTHSGHLHDQQHKNTFKYQQEKQLVDALTQTG